MATYKAGLARGRRATARELSISVAALIVILILPASVRAQAILARTVAESTRAPIASTSVVLLRGPSGDTIVAVGATGEDGRVLLRAGAPGVFRLRAEQIGYTAVTIGPFELTRDAEPLETELVLPVDPVAVSPIEVPVARQHSGLRVRGYYDRKEGWGRSGLGMGHFYEREEIDQRNPMRVSDLLRTIPGVRVEGVGGRDSRVTMRSVVDIRGGRCIPSVFIDGVFVGTWDTDTDALISIPDLIAVEVYPGINHPGQFQRSRCGSIVLWTGGAALVSPVASREHAEGLASLFGFEAQVGSGIGDFRPAETGLHWSPGVALRATLEWHLLRRVSLYGGASLTNFRCDQGFCEGRRVGFRSRGLDFGARATAALPGNPWVRLGMVMHELRTRWEEEGEPHEATSNGEIGVEVAGGIRIPLGALALTPGIRFVRYDAIGSASLWQADLVSLREPVRIVTFGVGLRIGP